MRCVGSSVTARGASKPAEVDARIADLGVIRGTLVAVLEAGCDDLDACAAGPRRTLPVAHLAAPAAG